MTLPSDQVNEIILDELRGLRNEVRDGFSETLQRLTVVETVTKPFFEKGGEKQQIEQDIQDLKKTKWMVLGGASALGAALSYIGHKIGLS